MALEDQAVDGSKQAWLKRLAARQLQQHPHARRAQGLQTIGPGGELLARQRHQAQAMTDLRRQGRVQDRIVIAQAHRKAAAPRIPGQQLQLLDTLLRASLELQVQPPQPAGARGGNGQGRVCQPAGRKHECLEACRVTRALHGFTASFLGPKNPVRRLSALTRGPIPSSDYLMSSKCKKWAQNLEQNKTRASLAAIKYRNILSIPRARADSINRHT
ncbi:hypothetical protein D3C78_1290890 [compost metagenome]